MILYLNVMKTFIFRTEMGNVTGDEKWMLYHEVEQKRSWSKRNEPPPTTLNSGQSSSKEGGDVDMLGLEGSPLL